jgi:hypothetical protein
MASSTSTSPTLATWLRRAARKSGRVLPVLPALPAAVSDVVLVVILALTVGGLTTDVGSYSSSAWTLANIK